jgi:hypothetical protein
MHRISPDDEINLTATVVQAARDAAAEHMQRATDALHLESTVLAHYKDFLNATILVAESTLANCRKMVAVPVMPVSECAQIVQGIMEGVRESVRAMYVVMTIVEQITGTEGQRNAQQGAIPKITENNAIRACAFCGKPEMQSKLAAGPAANICAPCTRLVCGVLGIRLSDSTPE